MTPEIKNNANQFLRGPLIRKQTPRTRLTFPAGDEAVGLDPQPYPLAGAQRGDSLAVLQVVVGEGGFVVALDVVEHTGLQLTAAVVVGAVVDQPEGV